MYHILLFFSFIYLYLQFSDILGSTSILFARQCSTFRNLLAYMKYNKTIVYYIYSQLPSASLQLAVCCRRIHGNKDSLHPVGCRSTDNKNTPLHVNMQGASLLSDICSADAVFIKLYSARYHSNSAWFSLLLTIFI